jgi:hypothetical protein
MGDIGGDLMSKKDIVKSLIPEYCRFLKIESIDDLLFLGKENINAMVGRKKGELDEIRDEIDTFESYIELLSGDLKEAAKEYEFVKIPQESLIESKEESGIMEPTREEDKERKTGTTTLNNCSWCDYLGSATMKYECGLEGKCDLLEKATPSSCDRGILSEGCVITKLDAEGIDCLVSGYQSNIGKKEKEAEKIRRQIKKLDALSEKAEDKPYLPELRPSDYFREGDEIIAYSATKGKSPQLIEGTVIMGYRSNDGMVSFQKKGAKGKKAQGFAGAERADALLKKDYEYLKSNQDFAEAYFLNSEKAYLEGFKEIVMGK